MAKTPTANDKAAPSTKAGKSMVSSTMAAAGVGRSTTAAATPTSNAVAAWDSANGLHLATGFGTGKQKAGMTSTAGMGDLIGSYTQFGIEPEQDQFDALDLMAQHVIDLLTQNVHTFANLTRFERDLLYRYFYKTNPVIGRLIDLHTDLPLSKTRLQAPSDLPNLDKDYIMQFFERVLARLNFPEFLRELVLAHGIYGETLAFVDDFYAEFSRNLEDMVQLEESVFDYTDEDQRFFDATELAYDEDPTRVNVKVRLDYINRKFKGFFEPDYKGPDRLSVVPFYKIQEYMENDDIDYVAVRYNLSEAFNQLRAQNEEEAFLNEVGYSKGIIALLREEDFDGKSIVVDNDENRGTPYLFRLRRPEGASIILRILNEALEWEAAKRAMRAKIESVGRVGRIVSAEGLSDAQTNMLRQEVQLMLEDPGYAIVANFDVVWQEVNVELRENLNNLTEATDGITQVLALGGGMPISLISGDAQYAGSSIKLEILNVEYHSFKQRIQTLIEEKLFKPMAQRKGFIGVDDWGNPTVYYPRLTFSRVSLRDESVFDILFNLYQKGSLPISVILDILNLDPDDVKRGIEGDLFTVNDPNFGEFARGMYTAAVDDVYSQTNLAERLMKELSLQPLNEPGQLPTTHGHPPGHAAPDEDKGEEEDPEKESDEDAAPAEPPEVDLPDQPMHDQVKESPYKKFDPPEFDPSTPADFNRGDPEKV